MKRFATPFAIVAVLLLAATAWGIWATRDDGSLAVPHSVRHAADRALAVDQASLQVAERLVHLPTTDDEKPFAEEALRIADNDMDLAFAQAVREAAAQKRSDSPVAREAQARLTKALEALEAARRRVASLGAARRTVAPAQALALDDQLNQAKAESTLAQDEAEDARQDLLRAGGDPQARMQEMMAQHDSASKGSDSVHVVVTVDDEIHGLVGTARRWRLLEKKEREVARAKRQADSLAVVFQAGHDRLEAGDANDTTTMGGGPLTHDASQQLLARTTRKVLDSKLRASLDSRHDDQRELSSLYGGWMALLHAQERALLNRALRDVAGIVAILVVTVLLSGWFGRKVGAHAVEGRRDHTSLIMARVAVQVVAVVAIILVIIGIPENFSTLLGLATAGLTVALKDLLMGFFGWFVLMGKNGIRVGDVVEVNGVTGEVVEIGIMRTEFLETGHWTEAGYPTGRRVSFSNSFAISGHYFNFSTAGRWLGDDVRVIVPPDRDAYPIGDALRQQAEAATAASAREAEAEWKAARKNPKAAVPSAGASVTFKPIVGGVEITVRFITRVTEREALRKQLFDTALQMIGGARPASPTPTSAAAV
ncbi:MAG: mechanosensitive ion channel [Gemmatimonadetes bacterium]|nr:mechanosensitive ion channel [Gemmatimonadota bacterium]